METPNPSHPTDPTLGRDILDELKPPLPPEPDRAPVVSTTDRIEAAIARGEASMAPEVASEPAKSEYSIEDYVDSLESVKNARRFLAKAYEKYHLKEGSKVEGLTTTDQRKGISKERPSWEEHLPQDDSVQEQQRWDEYVQSFPDAGIRGSLNYLQRVAMKHQQIKDAPELKDKIGEYAKDKLEVMAEVAAFRSLERQELAVIARIEALHARAVALGESECPDRELLAKQSRHIMVLSEARNGMIQSPKAAEELERRRNLDAKMQFDGGILMTEQMETVARQNMPALLQGEPLLLTGETGGAKTVLARELARRVLERTGKGDLEPEIISGHGEMNTYTLMGKSELISDEQGNIATDFVVGPIVRAMRDGKPLILDEVNAMPPEIIKRLNIIMQLRPGQTYSIQEDSGKVITAQPGFCIIGTMNEKSHRYRGVETLSVEFKDRFGSNRAQIRYPDQDTKPGETAMPKELIKLALLELTEKDGNVHLKHMTDVELMNLIRVAHYTQMLFTNPADDARLQDYIDPERLGQAASGATGLNKTVISPRTMLQIIHKVNNGGGGITIQEALSNLMIDVTDQTDKRIIMNLLKNYSLLPAKETNQPTTEETS